MPCYTIRPMRVTTVNKRDVGVLGASLFVPAPALDLYEALLDVRRFPTWAPGVRRVEVLDGPAGAGMVSEWEVALLGTRRRVSSVLKEAEPGEKLRWTYEGPVSGYGECVMRDRGDGVLAEFRTELLPEDALLRKVVLSAPARSAARGHLKRCLVCLGEMVCGDSRVVRVGPLGGF